MARRYKHGHFSNGVMSPTYRSWTAAKSRCNSQGNVAYARYGGAGIRVCEEWDEFENFLADMGERPEGTSLDRIDNSKGYSKNNCTWSTRVEQANNRHDVHFLEYKGERKAVAIWARELGMKPDTLYSRKMKGWTDEECITRPLRKWTRRGT